MSESETFKNAKEFFEKEHEEYERIANCRCLYEVNTRTTRQCRWCEDQAIKRNQETINE